MRWSEDLLTGDQVAPLGGGMRRSFCNCSYFLVGLLLLMIPARLSPAVGMNSNVVTSSGDRSNLDYFIIVTGSELLRGIYADGHTQFITKTLGPLGYRCLGSMSIGDVQRDLFKALDFAGNQASLILTTGGLGPTSQDITRKALSDYTEIELKEHPQALADLKRRFSGIQGVLRPILRGQALAPTQGTYLANPNGTAVGVVFDDGQRVIAALPGPPRELQPMVKNHLVPYLSERFGLRNIGNSLTMRFAAVGQSRIDQVIRDHLTLPKDLVVGSSFKANRVDITFSLPGNSSQEAKRLKSLENNLLEHIGEYMYSDNGSSLEERIFQLLEQQNTQLVVCEIASGGAVASSLLATEGASERFKGAYAAPSRPGLARLLGSVSNPELQSSVARDFIREMAQTASEKWRRTWSLAVGPVTLSDHGSASVWMAAGSVSKGFVTGKIGVRKGRKLRRARLVTFALDLLRKQL